MSARPALPKVDGPTVVAVGDIACGPRASSSSTTCQHAATADLAASYHPRPVLALGDLQYESGQLSDFRASYTPAWGDLKSATRPVPGNHEYQTDGAAGYYDFFSDQQPGAPGYYAFDVGSWRVYALNSNCSHIDCTTQNNWLDRDMGRHQRTCSIIAMHHPRYSSGQHGSNLVVRPFWRTARRHGADIALAGHDHDYERFARLNADGMRESDGILSFVSGTGGKLLRDFDEPVPGSVVRYNDTFGILALRLAPGLFAWEFATIDGDIVDSGVGTCQ